MNRTREEEGRQQRWWGYRHENGTYQVKRAWGDELTRAAIADARSSPFVDVVAGPFEARGRQQALARCKAIITARDNGRRAS